LDFKYLNLKFEESNAPICIKEISCDSGCRDERRWETHRRWRATVVRESTVASDSSGSNINGGDNNSDDSSDEIQ